MVVHIDPSRFNRTCPRCQANVHGTDVSTCPECGGSMVPACIGCGYDLAGLPREGLCPECGAPVAQAYAPDLLENRSVGYLLQLRSGLTMVVTGILCNIGLMLIAVAIGAASRFGSSLPGGAASAWGTSVQLITQLLGLGLSVLVLLGWWKITTPDPSRIGAGLDVKPRQIIRVAVVVQVATSLVGLLPIAAEMGSPPAAIPLAFATMGIGLVGTAAWITQFFAAMLYLQWLARRVPDDKLHADTKRFMWLGPLLYVVGCVLLGLGPIVALVLYLLMLFTLRKHLTLILARLGAI